MSEQNAATAAPKPYLLPYPDMTTDGRAVVQCRACSAYLTPRLHMPTSTGACQAGCSKEWQTAGPHLRWSCDRCGWSADDACTRPVSDLTHSGRPLERDVADIPF